MEYLGRSVCKSKCCQQEMSAHANHWVDTFKISPVSDELFIDHVLNVNKCSMKNNNNKIQDFHCQYTYCERNTLWKRCLRGEKRGTRKVENKRGHFVGLWLQWAVKRPKLWRCRYVRLSMKRGRAKFVCSLQEISDNCCLSDLRKGVSFCVSAAGAYAVLSCKIWFFPQSPFLFFVCA